jgi:glycosyltransferase involved in cell wall biosynthesis
MKVLYLITKSNWGGAQRYVFDCATEGQKAGADVVVAFGGHGQLEERLKESGVRTISLPDLMRDVSVANDVKVFFAITLLLFTEEPTVIHLNSSKIGGIGGVAGRYYNLVRFITRRPGAQIIFTGHGWAFTEERPDRERIIIALLHWMTIQLAHKTVAVSRKTREEVSRIPFTWHKMTVIHNGVGEWKGLEREAAQRQLLGKDYASDVKDKPLIIGTIGELHKNKGHSYALDGIAQLKKQTDRRIFFIIIGTGEEEDTLRKKVVDLGLEENVVFATDRQSDAAEYLNAFDIFLFPSIKEGFPYAILEAGKAGLPIIASAVGGIPEIIDDMESGILIQSKNPGEIARALKFLVDDEGRRHLMGAKIAQRIKDRFSVEEMARQTLDLYTDTR